MSEFTAKDVKALRDATGAGMMDCKRALTENDGDMEAATQWLREKGMAKAAARAERASDQGTVALAVDGNTAAIVELRCETDFSAKADDFTSLADRLVQQVLTEGEQAVDAPPGGPSKTSPWPRRRTSDWGRWSGFRPPTAASSTPTFTPRTAVVPAR